MKPAIDQLIESQPNFKSFSHSKYRPDIDGLRAIAALSVVGFHAFPNWIPGGFIGVDIFFVISGFLISGIIIGKLETSGFSYTEFYSRRIKRIFPALIVVLIFTSLMGWYVLLADEYSQLNKHIASGVGFIANLSFWQEAGYFDSSAATKPLLHLWSLGVEEQFYIFWPLLLSLIWRQRVSFLCIVSIVAAASFAINLSTLNSYPEAAFYSPLSRLWEPLIGGVLAYLTFQKPQHLARWSNWQSLAGLMLIMAGFILLRESSPFPGWWALLPTTGAFLIISAGPNAWINQHILGSKILVWFGLISFPLYLWHWPLLSYEYIIFGNALPIHIRVTTVAISILLAWLTYILLEKKIRPQRGNIPVVILLFLAFILLVFGLLGWKNKISPRNDNSDLSSIIQAVHDRSYPPSDFDAFQFSGQLFYRKSAAAEQVIFLGDSHVEQYYPRISKILSLSSPANRTVIVATFAGVPPIPSVAEDKHPGSNEFLQSAIKMIQNKAIDTVVIGGCWNCYFIEEAKEKAPEEMRHHFYYVENGEKKYFRHQDGVNLALISLERFLAELSLTKKVYLLLDNPIGEAFNPKNYFEGSRLTQLRRKQSSSLLVQLNTEQAALRERLTSIATRANVEIIDPTTTLCHNNKCIAFTTDGAPIYKDTNHLRPFYVRDSATFIDVAITK